MNCAHLERYEIDVIRISCQAMHDGEGPLDDQIRRRSRTIGWKAVKSYLLYNLVNKKETIVNDERNCLGWKNVKYPHKFELIMHLSPENRQYSWKIIKAKMICIVHTFAPLNWGKFQTLSINVKCGPYEIWSSGLLACSSTLNNTNYNSGSNVDHRPQQSTWYGTFGFHQAKSLGQN